MADDLATTKRNLGLGYGDIALVGQQIIRCLEYEFDLRDTKVAEQEAAIENLQGRLAAIEAQMANFAEVP